MIGILVPETLSCKLVSYVYVFLCRAQTIKLTFGIQPSEITTATCLYRIGKPVALHVGL